MINKITENIKTKHGTFCILSSDLYIGNSLKKYGEYSEIELSIMTQFIKSEDYIFDIGSNIGAFTIPFSKKVGKLGKIYSFEPQKEIFKLLQENIKQNKLTNVELYRAGLGKKQSSIDLTYIDYSIQDNFGGVSLLQNLNNPFYPKDEDLKQKIAIMCLDQFLSIKRCDFIKLDVEGMEQAVLAGGKKFLNKYRPIMWIENSRVFPNPLNKYLLDVNYDLYWALSFLFNPDNYLKSKINYFPNICTENILAIPKEKNINTNVQNLDKISNDRTPPEKVHCKINL